MILKRPMQTAVDRMMEARPIVVGVARAIDVIPGMQANLFLHAGPPVTWERMAGPMRGALIGAIIFEKLAKNAEEAVQLIESKKVRWEPCHHHASVGPMAGLIAPSFLVYVVEDKTLGLKTYSGLNEGRGKVLRMGAYSEDVLTKLHWMNDVLGPIVERPSRTAAAWTSAHC